jgi:DNA mismatch repair protein MutS
MFSTHYHEITKIEKEIPSIKNVHVSVADKGDEITFLYKIQDGAMGKSYGINVARLASLPEELLIRSSEILDSLEENGVQTSSNVLRENVVKVPSWVEEVKKVDPLSMSPMEALNFLYDLKKKMGGK